MKLLALLLAALLAPAFLPCCVTNPETGEREPDWELVSKGFELGAKRLRDPALDGMVAPFDEDGSIRAAIEKAAAACDAVSKAVAAYEDPDGGGSLAEIAAAVRAVTTAAALIAPLIETDDPYLASKVQAAVFAINSAIDIYEILAPDPDVPTIPLAEPAPAG